MQPFFTDIFKRPIPAWALVMALGSGFACAYALSFLNLTGQTSRAATAGSGTTWAELLIPVIFVVAAALLIAAAMYYSPRLLNFSQHATPTDDTHSKVLLQTGLALNLELGKVLGIIRSRIGSDESYALSLANAQTRLAELPTSEQVRVIVGLLVAENHRMRLDSVNMGKQLDASRLQIEGLRLRLERAQEVGLQDALTLVGNRRCFDVALASALKEATVSASPLSIVMGDLDQFKLINDQYGHPVGDEVLKFFTQLMVGSVRDGDTVARFGGEEFAIILPQCSGHEASSIAERIRIKLSAKSLTIRRTSQDIGIVTASFGVAQLRPGEVAESLISRTDRALYTAKKTGRNRVSIA